MRVVRTIGPARTRRKRRSLLTGPPAEPGRWGRRLWWTARGIALGAAGLAAAAGVLYAWERAAWLPALALREVEVRGAATVPAEDIRCLAGVSPGEPLLLVSLERVRQGVLRHPWLAEASVARRLPGTLAILVRERVPLAVVSQSGGFALVDREGRVLALGPAGGPGGDRFPIVGGVSGQTGPGGTVFEALPALAALAALEGPGGLPADRISEVTAGPDGRILVSLTGTGTVLVMGRDDPEGQAARLARLAAAGAFDLRGAGYDLRFVGRVVRLPDRREGGAGGKNGVDKERKGGKGNGQG